MSRFIFLTVILLFPFSGQGQADSKVFDFKSFLSGIVDYHPLANQADLILRSSQLQLMKARGGFDPKLFADMDQKSFDSKSYFTVGKGGIKIPTKGGLELTGSYNWTRGIFLNPQNNLPENGQIKLGVKANLLQGLVIDERRANLDKAFIQGDANRATYQVLLNNLLLDAGLKYWDWAYYFQVQKIIEEALELAELRFENTKINLDQGKSAPVDTVESFLNVQDRIILLNESNQNLIKATQAMNDFLWVDEQNVFQVSINDVPTSFDTLNYNLSFLTQNSAIQALNTHPQLTQLYTDLQKIEIDQRLKKDKLKPKLSFEYNFLSNSALNRFTNDGEFSFNELITENYQWAANFSFPLFLRKQRADIQLNEIKGLQTNNKYNQKKLELTNKVNNSFQQLSTIAEQIEVLTISVNRYRYLLEAENERFNIGESSIFLINSREQKLIDAQLKLAKTLVAFQKEKVLLLWYKGNLMEDIFAYW